MYLTLAADLYVRIWILDLISTGLKGPVARIENKQKDRLLEYGENVKTLARNIPCHKGSLHNLRVIVVPTRTNRNI